MKDKPWWKSKTIWVGLTGVIVGIIGYFTGDLTLYELLRFEIMPFGFIFLRVGVGNNRE